MNPAPAMTGSLGQTTENQKGFVGGVILASHSCFVYSQKFVFNIVRFLSLAKSN